MTRRIVSIGYEGRTIEEFVDVLRDHQVSAVADVRLTPLSRKPGFSKTRLTAALAEAGIVYVHLRPLGNEKDNREPFWSGRVDEARATFRQRLSSPEPRAALAQLAELAGDHAVAVLCFESDPARCHRHVVLDELAHDMPLSVTYA
ncbi:DUF488 domain-containing protein [Aeromicrobium sp. YIM 150415]|uniref:DUF488 domain-containing protein n=1 Tax=Aeromicrobium sp. YIM 150415 TaxID=2803912 RepID=UPI0019662128|nr:DUF488 domain-containing protein [Aeromicrobium sp. YIM 150415]MBM9463433.1 DUF488 domain-containing protein [Aeromicrobium sp. YIM 150415]